MTVKARRGIFETAQHNVLQAIERLRLEPDIANFLIDPRERVEITFNPIGCDGRLHKIKAFVVRHSDILGPAKGGIRMMPNVTLEDVSGLAMEMTWKTALMEIPFGGGKSGIQCDASLLDEDTKEVVIRGFTRGLMNHIGPELYVPAPDMGTSEIDMGHLADCISYSSGKAITSGCFVTGKPLIMGGIKGRKEATGRGVYFSICEAAKKLDLEVKNLKVAIQGFGNVGGVVAHELFCAGATIVAVADIYSGLYNAAGLNIEELLEYVQRTGAVKNFPGGRQIYSQDVLTTDCDVLIPAAAGSQITSDNASEIKARVIAEGANAPTTPGGDKILNELNVFFIPDILCNAGGVFVSYLEYTQETQREQMEKELVQERLEQRMSKVFNKVYEYSCEKSVSMREAAMDIAVKRVYDGVVARGFFP